MTLPDVRNPENAQVNGMEIVVLDLNGIHVFDSRGKKRATFYEGQGSFFRHFIATFSAKKWS